MSILNIENLYYRSNNTNIINGVSFQVEERDCVSIIGSSGSGKSTLLKLCADLIEITDGNIYYKNKNYKEYNPLELRKRISYCVQMPHIFGEKVYENLEFPYKIRKEKFNKEKVVKLLNKFNLDEDILEKEVKSLSGGEKQRISLIRNFIYTPDVLLLDEATSALDRTNAKKVEEYVKELNEEGTTVVWITHSIEQSEEIFNKRITMSEGKIQGIERIK